MKFIPNSVTRKVARTMLKLDKHSPNILFAAGIVGFGATVVMASRATLKLDSTLDDIQTDRKILEHKTMTDSSVTEEEFKKESAKLYGRSVLRVAKLYAPTVVVGVVSVACLTKSHQILTTRNASLTAAYTALADSYDKYRRRVQEEIGEDREEKLYYDAQQETVTVEGKNGPKEKKVLKAGANGASPYAKFFDNTNHNWQGSAETNRYFLDMKQKWCNQMLMSRGHLFLNDVYRELGLEDTKAGAVVGWVLGENETNYVDFGMYNSDDPAKRAFVNGHEDAILLDFNVRGIILDLI